MYAVPGDPLPSSLSATTKPHPAAVGPQSLVPLCLLLREAPLLQKLKARPRKCQLHLKPPSTSPKKPKLEDCSITNLQRTWNMVATIQLSIAFNDLDNYG